MLKDTISAATSRSRVEVYQSAHHRTSNRLELATLGTLIKVLVYMSFQSPCHWLVQPQLIAANDPIYIQCVIDREASEVCP